MKVFIQKQSDRFTIPDDAAVLEKINPDGSFVYCFKYEASIPKIMGNGNGALDKEANRTVSVLISVIKNIPLENDLKLFNQGFDAEAIIKKLKHGFAMEKQLGRRKKDALIQVKLSDITKKIPNDRLHLLITKYNGDRERMRSQRPDPKAVLGLTRQIEVKVKSVKGLQAGFRAVPILELNLNKNAPATAQAAAVTSRDIRAESLNLLFKYGIDPACFVGERTNSLFPASKQHAGVISKFSHFSRNQNDPVMKRKTDILVRSCLTTAAPGNLLDLPSAQFVNVTTKIEDDIARVKETMIIEEGKLTGDTFIVQFDLVNSKGLVVQTLKRTVRHALNVSLLQRPVVAPFLSIATFGKKGRNLIQLRQLDENASKIALYKKEFKPSTFNLTQEYEKVDEVDLEASDGTVYTEDTNLSNNTVIYRAIPIGVNGDLGAEFSCAVSSGEKIKTGGTQNYYRRPTFLSLYNEIQGKTNKLFIDNIPNEPISLEVMRRDMSLKESFKVIDTVYLKSEPNRPVEVQDSGLKANRVYEYKCKLLFADGAKVDAGNNLMVDFTPLETNIVNTSIRNLNYDQDDDIIDVTFNIVKSAIPTNLAAVKAALEDQGFDEYNDDVKKKKDKLQKLFFIKVLRTNLLDGEVEDFGIIEGDRFSDKDMGPVRNVSELQTGRTYKYAVVVYARSAETLIPGFTRLANSGSREEYTLTPGKFLHPVTLGTQGAIVTETSLLRNHAESAFTQGEVVDIKYVNVDLGSFLPKIQEAKAEVVNSGRTLLRWGLKGNSGLIDHFLIILEINGIRTIVGKAHSIGGQNSFQFVDSLDNGEHGALEYLITPVYYDFSRGAEVRCSAIFI